MMNYRLHKGIGDTTPWVKFLEYFFTPKTNKTTPVFFTTYNRKRLSCPNWIWIAI